MPEILDGKELAQKIRSNLKIKVDELKLEGIHPKLAVIMIGEDPSSKIYVRNKSKACEEIGIEYEEFLLKDTIQMEELLKLIDTLNKRQDVHGILLQSPIPNNLDINLAFKRIVPEKDVDGFNPVNVGRLCLNQDGFVSCTPFGVMKLLEEYNIDVEGKNAVLIGRSNIVGKPMAQCLLNKNATITICHSKTKKLDKRTNSADILISVVGKFKFVKKADVEGGAE